MIEFILDTADIKAIDRLVNIYPVAGVTSNPGILKSEGKIDFFSHMRKIREIIGHGRSLHIQVIAEDFNGIVKDAETILRKVDDGVYIKIPASSEGIRAMGFLAAKGIHVTATSVYTGFQGFMSASQNADYIALYYNRMENMDINADHTIKSLRTVFDREKLSSKILAASFRNVRQTADAIIAGAHSITAAPAIFDDAFGLSIIKSAVDGFHLDWAAIHGEVTLADL